LERYGHVDARHHIDRADPVTGRGAGYVAPYGMLLTFS
jgi:hypothetical protein